MTRHRFVYFLILTQSKYLTFLAKRDTVLRMYSMQKNESFINDKFCIP